MRRWRGSEVTAEDVRRSIEVGRIPRDREVATLVSRIREADRARRRAAFVIGQALAVIQRKKLWANLGHASFAEAAVSLGVSRAQAFKLVVIGERSTAEEVEKLGVEAAYARAVRRRR